MWRRGGVEVTHSARDNASTAGTVTALTVPYTPESPTAQREQLSEGKQHLVHTRSELRARWKEAG